MSVTLTDSDGREFSILEKHDLRCTENGANKFWQGTVTKHDNPYTKDDRAKPWVVFLSWGKVGTLGQQKENRFTREHRAKAYLDGRLRHKTRNGYVSTTKTVLPTQKIEQKVGISHQVETDWDLF